MNEVLKGDHRANVRKKYKVRTRTTNTMGWDKDAAPAREKDLKVQEAHSKKAASTDALMDE